MTPPPSQVRRLGDQYVADGDLWHFLFACDRAVKEQQAEARREREEAATFVRLVVEARGGRICRS